MCLLSRSQNIAYLNCVDYCEFFVNSFDFFPIRFISKRFIFLISYFFYNQPVLASVVSVTAATNVITVIMVGMGGFWTPLKIPNIVTCWMSRFQGDPAQTWYNILGFLSLSVISSEFWEIRYCRVHNMTSHKQLTRGCCLLSRKITVRRACFVHVFIMKPILFPLSVSPAAESCNIFVYIEISQGFNVLHIWFCYCTNNVLGGRWHLLREWALNGSG